VVGMSQPRDDRGRPCGLPERLLDGPAAEADEEAETLWEDEYFLRRLDFWREPLRAIETVVFAFGSVLVMGVPISTHWLLGWPRWIGWAVGIGAMVTLLPLWMRWDRRERFGFARESFLKRGVCPSCSYPLNRCPSDTDGCTVCPECGAAWRLAVGGRA